MAKSSTTKLSRRNNVIRIQNPDGKVVELGIIKLEDYPGRRKTPRELQQQAILEVEKAIAALSERLSAVIYRVRSPSKREIKREDKLLKHLAALEKIMAKIRADDPSLPTIPE